MTNKQTKSRVAVTLVCFALLAIGTVLGVIWVTIYAPK